MNLLSWLTCLALFLLILAKAGDFYYAMVCRQKAWLASTELLTRSLLQTHPSPEREYLSQCGLWIQQSGQVSWLYENKKRAFNLGLQGKL